MTSQLNVDTIKGNETAGSITIQGEGSKTTNLQQGLAKAWNHYDQKGDSGSTQILDSFNMSSATDSSAGVSVHNFGNDMNNNYSATAAISIDRGTANLFTSGPETSVASGSVKLSCLNAAGSAADGDSLMVITCGDLA